MVDWESECKATMFCDVNTVQIHIPRHVYIRIFIYCLCDMFEDKLENGRSDDRRFRRMPLLAMRTAIVGADASLCLLIGIGLFFAPHIAADLIFVSLPR